jgi:hypothetical protein
VSIEIIYKYFEINKMSAGWAPGQLSIEQAELSGSMKMTAFWDTVQCSLIEVGSR